MNKDQTKKRRELYETPRMYEHLLGCQSGLMQTSVGGPTTDLIDENQTWE